MTDQNWGHLRDICGSDSDYLRGKTIVLAISASVAALETPRLARALMRHGARVVCFLTPAASQLISPTLLEWCTAGPVIDRLSGRCEHLEFFGHRGKGDLLLLAPATANTVGKIANGIDDNAVTTAATTALGSGVPIFCCPGMHEPMLANLAVQRNLESLRELGITVLEPKLAEGKAKMMEVPQILARILRRLSSGPLRGKRVLLTGGPTREYLDPARCLTNPSSGLSACLLAEEAYRLGAEVSMVYGPGLTQPPPWVEIVRVETGDQMADSALRMLAQAHYDFILAVAAVADFRPKERMDEKLPTSAHPHLEIELVRTPKILDQMRAASPDSILVAFKASSSARDEELIEQSQTYLRSNRADVVVANSITQPGMGFEQPDNRYLLCRDGTPALSMGPASKQRLAEMLWEALLEL